MVKKRVTDRLSIESQVASCASIFVISKRKKKHTVNKVFIVIFPINLNLLLFMMTKVRLNIYRAGEIEFTIGVN